MASPAAGACTSSLPSAVCTWTTTAAQPAAAVAMGRGLSSRGRTVLWTADCSCCRRRGRALSTHSSRRGSPSRLFDYISSEHIGEIITLTLTPTLSIPGARAPHRLQAGRCSVRSAARSRHCARCHPARVGLRDGLRDLRAQSAARGPRRLQAALQPADGERGGERL